VDRLSASIDTRLSKCGHMKCMQCMVCCILQLLHTYRRPRQKLPVVMLAKGMWSGSLSYHRQHPACMTEAVTRWASKCLEMSYYHCGCCTAPRVVVIRSHDAIIGSANSINKQITMWHDAEGWVLR